MVFPGQAMPEEPFPSWDAAFPGCTSAPRSPLLEAIVLKSELQATNAAGLILFARGRC